MYARRALGWRCCHEASCCLLCCPVRHSASSEAFRGVFGSKQARRIDAQQPQNTSLLTTYPLNPIQIVQRCGADDPLPALLFLAGVRPCRLRVPVPRWTAVRIRRLACGRPVSRGLRPHIDMDALKLRCHSSRGLRPENRCGAVLQTPPTLCSAGAGGTFRSPATARPRTAACSTPSTHAPGAAGAWGTPVRSLPARRRVGRSCAT